MSENNHTPAPHSVTFDLGGRNLTLETGKIAKQANGAVTARYGDTVVLVTACMSTKPIDRDFLPLTVDYRENTYSAGKIPGGFFKREGRPSEREILASRLIDRPMRPLFPDSWRNETQIMAMVLSADSENDPDVIARNRRFGGGLYFRPAVYRSHRGGSRGLAGRQAGGESLDCRTEDQQDEHHHCRRGKRHRDGGIGRVRSFRRADCRRAGIRPCADQAHHRRDQGTARATEAEEGGSGAAAVRQSDLRQHEEELRREAARRLNTEKHPKKESYQLVDALLKEITKAVPEEDEEKLTLTKRAFERLREEIFRDDMLKAKRRPDGRAFDQIRKITCEVGLLPRVHGSALFTRGETQALATLTLGTKEDMQRLDLLFEQDQFKRFMLHYNFPPFSVGEVKFLRGPGRREIGHGALAERALRTCCRPRPISRTPCAWSPTSWNRTVPPRWPRFAAVRWR